jgi:hypothetical protein
MIARDDPLPSLRLTLFRKRERGKHTLRLRLCPLRATEDGRPYGSGIKVF